MTTLPIEEKLIYRSIKRAAIVWLLLLRLDPEPVTEATAADILHIDRSTARGYLKDLSEINICTRLGRYNGYILTQTGRQLSLPFELLGKGEIPPSSISINKESDKALKTDEQLILIREGENPTLDLELTYENFPEVSAALIKYKIKENSRTKLLLIDLTPRDIGQIAMIFRRTSYSFTADTGLFITMLEHKQEQNRSGRNSYADWEAE